jgi:hypothetical protein
MKTEERLLLRRIISEWTTADNTKESLQAHEILDRNIPRIPLAMVYAIANASDGDRLNVLDRYGYGWIEGGDE